MHGALAGLACVLVGCWTVAPASLPAQEIRWDSLAPGLEAALWTPGDGCRNQVPPLAIVKVDPERYRFATYHFRDEGLASPPTVQEWQRRLGATVLFNAGLFREDYSYLGLLYRNGRSLGSKRHPQWQGLFVAEPVEPGLRKARVVDLAAEPLAPQRPAYREAAQSLMLVDRSGKPRVRQTGKRAHQTVVGEDGAGHILILKTADETTLWDLALCLRDRFPLLVQAMAMDGGNSSDVLVAGAALAAHTGRDAEGPTWLRLLDGSGTAHIPLPAVIGLFPRGSPQPPALSR
ncbi:phosphodiester glycosidase family protein [Nitrospira sp. Kam-Ns4a]